jgi:hypothetical protein
MKILIQVVFHFSKNKTGQQLLLFRATFSPQHQKMTKRETTQPEGNAK